MNHVSSISLIETFLLMKLIPKRVWVCAKRASTKCNLLQSGGTWEMGKIFHNVQYHWMLH